MDVLNIHTHCHTPKGIYTDGCKVIYNAIYKWEEILYKKTIKHFNRSNSVSSSNGCGILLKEDKFFNFPN